MAKKQVFCIVNVHTQAAPYRGFPNVAIRSVHALGYTLGIDVHGQRKEWATERAAEQALRTIRRINQPGADCLKVFARYI